MHPTDMAPLLDFEFLVGACSLKGDEISIPIEKYLICRASDSRREQGASTALAKYSIVR